MPFEIPTNLDIPDGTYPAVLESVDENVPEGQFGKMRKWTWLIEHDGEVTAFSQMTSQNNGPKTVSYAWLTALIGKAPLAGERIEDPTGTRVLLQMSKKDNGYMKIDAVLPYTEPQQVLPGVPR